MARILSGGSARKWNIKEDRFTAEILAFEERLFTKPGSNKEEKGHALTFADKAGTVIERHATAQWARWFGLDIRGKGKKQTVTKCKPELRVGDVVTVKDITQKDGKGGTRFYDFVLEVLDGKDRPKWATRASK